MFLFSLFYFKSLQHYNPSNDIHNKNTYVPFAFTSMQRICRSSYPRNYTTCQFRASISSCLKLNLNYHNIIINMHSFLIAKILSIYDQEICTFDPVSFLTPKSSSNSWITKVLPIIYIYRMGNPYSMIYHVKTLPVGYDSHNINLPGVCLNRKSQ